MNYTRELIRFCDRLIVQQGSLIRKVKQHLMDFLGVALRGYERESSKLIIDISRDKNGNGTILRKNIKTSAEHAALANGVMAHATEFDDLNTEGAIHPAAFIFPAAMASSEMVTCNGIDFIKAVVAGYETAVRLGKAVGAREHYSRGFHPTGTCGAFGATVTASKILGLDEKEMVNAVGITGSLTSGSMAFLQNGAWTKRLHPGWAAHNGILASKLAKKGFIGPENIFDGKYGFLPSFSVEPNYDSLTENLGESYQILKTSIKNYACCRHKHSALDAIINIVSKNNLEPRIIEQIDIQLYETAIPIIAEPEEVKYNPKTVVDAQFSMPFGAAVATLRKKASINEYHMNLISSDKVKNIIQKVKCRHNSDLDKAYPEAWPSIVRIKTKKDKIFEKRVDYPKGDPKKPMNWKEIVNKFDYLTEDLYSAKKREKIKETIQNLEKVKNIENNLMKIL